jgi:hypothetical protein
MDPETIEALAKYRRELIRLCDEVEIPERWEIEEYKLLVRLEAFMAEYFVYWHVEERV